MNTRLLYTRLLLCLFPIAAAFGQSMRFEQISVADGLSHTSVFHVMQDSKGTILICTANGLNKYDGYDFRTFYADQSDSTALSNDNLSSMLQGAGGAVWIGTWGGGLNRFDPHTETFRHYEADFSKEEKLSDGRIQALFQHEKSASVWVGTFAGGLNKFNPKTGKFTRYMHDEKDPHSISNNRIWSMCDAGNGRMFVGTSQGLNLFDTASRTFERFYIDPAASIRSEYNQIRTLHRTADGRVWAGTEHGLYWFDYASRAFVQVKGQESWGGSNDKSINSLTEYPEGVLWVGTQRNGLIRLDTHTGFSTAYIHNPQDLFSIGDNDVRDVYIDRSRVMWISTRRAGMSKVALGGNKFEKYGMEEGLSDRQVMAIAGDKAGNIWVGSLLGGINVISPNGKVTSIANLPTNSNSLIFNEIHSILEDHAGYIWIATERGLDRYDPVAKKFIHYTHKADDQHSIVSNQVKVVYEDMTGRIWIGTKDHGIQYLDSETGHWVSVPLAGNLYAQMVEDIAEGPARTLWIGTDAGLFQLETKDSMAVTPMSNLPKHSVRTIYKPSGDEIWLGTTHGVIRYNIATKHVTEILAKDGLPSNQIDAILPDNEGNLWISSGRGLTKYSPETGQLRNYDLADGLQSNVFNVNAAHRSPNGKLFFGGINGFNAFFPAEIIDRATPPVVQITSFSKMGKEVAFDKPIDEIQEIVLTHLETVFSFKFAALDYVNPSKNAYAYKMEGIDEDWIYCGNDRSVTYSHLSPGQYVFSVKGSNSDKVWNDVGASVRVRIVPPFWQERWFLASLALFITTGIGLVLWIRLAYLQKMRKRLEQEVRLRTAQLTEEKDKLSNANVQITQNLEEISAQRDEIEAQRNDIFAKHARLEKAIDEIQWQNQAIREQKGEIEQRQKLLEEAQGVIEQKNLALQAANHLLEEKVEQRTQELDRAYKDLLRIHKQLDHFTYRSAHDLKGPIARLLGLCYLGKMEVADAKTAEDLLRKSTDYLQRLENTAQEMNTLLGRLMRAHEVKTKNIEYTNFSLRTLVGSIVKEQHWRTADVRIALDIPDTIMLHSDYVLVRIMLENLFDNALQYQRTGALDKQIWIHAEVLPAGQLSIAVADNGIGVAVEVADQIFDMFVVGSSQSGGAGLGLYEASIIAERLRGKVWLKAYNQERTVFEAILPLA